MKAKILIAALCLLFSITGCKTFQTAYFGVEDKAVYTPPEFAQTVETVEKAKKDAFVHYQKQKIQSAMAQGKSASDIYWACHDVTAKAVLAQARKSAYQSEMFHPQPPPPTANSAYSTIPPPETPDSLRPDAPFAGIKALPPELKLGSVGFDFNSAGLKENELPALDKKAPIMIAHTLYEIAGHTDALGKDSYNQKLSEKRAANVKKYLTSKGVPEKKMVSTGYGEASPVATNSTEAGQAKNRRAEIRVLPPLFPNQTLTDPGALPAGTTIELVNFSFGSNRLLPVYEPVLDRVAKLLTKNPGANMEIAGFADNTGPARINRSISKKRAKIVFKYLASKGVKKSRLRITGYGEKYPLVNNDTAKNRSLNRRVEIRTR
ncbi:MAG: OmpA family protein [Deltaproteobacteria bacterium]|nr:OmpA family protein [Deltaproteobacteria bacterium]